MQASEAPEPSDAAAVDGMDDGEVLALLRSTMPGATGGPARARAGDRTERECPACGVIWNPNTGGLSCPACARNDDHVGLAAAVLQAARAAGYPRLVLAGVGVVAGPAGWAAFAQSAPGEALELALARLGRA